ncbi:MULTISPECIES: hypothetical protein [Parabacteroides]|jgi:hypothetical protein|uniref:Transposase n=1 Tax=Parabacteroides faecis TaxID=1217282 RepID=A0ABR6KFT9_9BACT|nr:MULTISPECIES: hypothetical protein [Parabacteroides]MBB4620375.1 hypothetical protein [Parabacteroides faecis]GGJ96942.1 hypothetical protein GCM10007084_20790 [Parabacteroides faecis]
MVEFEPANPRHRERLYDRSITVGKTSRNEDIAKRIVEEGSEIKYDTLLSIINQMIV